MNLPETSDEAKAAIQHPLNFVKCLFCGHVFNKDFDADNVEYTKDSCHMFNQGAGWQTHMKNVIHELQDFPLDKVAIDIGCGDGSFFNLLQQAAPKVEYIGFDPGPEVELIDSYTAIQDYFVPEVHLKQYDPSFICLRHVVEHLPRPMDFLADLAYWCGVYRRKPVLMIEVPCFNKAENMGRIGDLIYEHISHFTTNSLDTLVSNSGFRNIRQSLLYDDEVLINFSRPDSEHVRMNKIYGDQFVTESAKIRRQLNRVLDLEVGASTALWGATGKSAGFINTYGLDADRFPLVVDSDEGKCGKFVPGTGQEIKHSTHLLTNPVDVIIITTHWRAKDIYQEIKDRNIPHQRVLYLDGASLVDYRE